MDIRPCPRCCKLVPSEASFCRRCGVAMCPRAAGGACCHRADHPAAAEVRLGSRWASTIAATATAALGVVLALFAVSGPRVAVRDGEPPKETSPLALTDDATGASAEDFGSDFPESPQPLPGFSATRKQSTPAARFPHGSPAAAFHLRNPPRADAPEITAVVSPRAGYGHKVTISGSRLAGARQVVFIGADRRRAEARFVVWDDGHLIVSVPDLGRWRQDAAVAVVTNDGVAVSVPAGAPSFGSTTAYAPGGAVGVVPRGEVFDGAATSALFVEDGAAARASGGATLFVREGGSLWGRGGGDCLVYCERGVIIRSDVSACDIVEVPAVNASVVRSPFHYTGR